MSFEPLVNGSPSVVYDDIGLIVMFHTIGRSRPIPHLSSSSQPIRQPTRAGSVDCRLASCPIKNSSTNTNTVYKRKHRQIHLRFHPTKQPPNCILSQQPSQQYSRQETIPTDACGLLFNQANNEPLSHRSMLLPHSSNGRHINSPTVLSWFAIGDTVIL